MSDTVHLWHDGEVACGLENPRLTVTSGCSRKYFDEERVCVDCRVALGEIVFTSDAEVDKFCRDMARYQGGDRVFTRQVVH